MAGGGNALDIVELFNLENSTSCVLDVKLDVERRYLTGDGDLVCGGINGSYTSGDVQSSCYNITTQNTINLINGRYEHTSWAIGDSIYLIGGGPEYTTTELITRNSTKEGFPLKYPTL